MSGCSSPEAEQVAGAGVRPTQTGEPESCRRVLVLYTGGSIGMKMTEKGYEPVSNYLDCKLRTYPMLHDTQFNFSGDCRLQKIGLDPLALPRQSENKNRVIYCILELTPLLDSSNMSMSDWARISSIIETHYDTFDAFVVLHGTDTMAYTASALSFMLENLGKTVIITGSQIPLSKLRSDGRDNFLGALIIAGNYTIPEVLLFFNNKLLRGNRAVKTNSAEFDAFTSPNLPPLAVIGVDIKVEWNEVLWPSETERFHIQSNMSPNVGILRMFPGITIASVRSLLQSPIQGVILQTYGSGNFPDKQADLLEELKQACDRGVIIVNCSQCPRGRVTDSYAAGRVLQSKGIITGYDMTLEAALTKLSYLLGKEMTLEDRRHHMQKNLRGELTQCQETRFFLKYNGFFKSLASSLHLSTNKEVKMLSSTLLPSLMCSAAAEGDVNKLEKYYQEGGNFNLSDHTKQTPLHIASSCGHLEAVTYLLNHGASVHAKDNNEHTPLYLAAQKKYMDVIKLLVKTGAHLQAPPQEVAIHLCLAASKNDTMAIKAWQEAGADLSLKDYAGRTALDVAKQQNCSNAVSLLDSKTLHQ